MEENDDIDLRPYVLAVLRRWPWIVALVALSMALTLVVASRMPKTYTATASVLVFVQRTGSQINTNEPILNIETIDVASRRQGLLALAGSTAIETQLTPELLAQAAPRNYKPGMLVEKGYIDATAKGDLLEIRANGVSPQQAQALANAWATNYDGYVQTLYTDDHSRVQLAGSAIPPFEPSAPKPLRNAVIAGMLTLIVLIAVIVLQQLTGSTFALPRRQLLRRERQNKLPSAR